MKKTSLLTACIMTASIIMSGASAANAQEISILVNGTKIQPQTPPIIENGRTLVPLRAISEALGCDVAWNNETQGITLTDGSSLYFTWIGRDHAFKTSAAALEGSCVMDVPPVIMNDYTMVPLRAISEMFGADVNWDAASYTVTVDYDTKSVTSGLAAEFASYERALDEKYDIYTAYVDGTENKVYAEIKLENGSSIQLELYPDIAPITVNNFVKLAEEGFYDGLIFHRVISGFMIQGGGYDTNMSKKSTDTITGEFLQNGYFNLIPHERGVISMARTMQSMDSASSQFFIMHADYHSLDGQYAAFGKVISGMEAVDKIASVQTQSIESTGMSDVPVENQIIKTITITK